MCPQSTVSCPPSWCHDNSGHRECFVFSGLGTSEVQSLPSLLACGHNTQVPCTHVVWNGLHVLGVFGAGPASFLLCHTSTVERLDLRVYILGALQRYGYQQCQLRSNTFQISHSVPPNKALCHVHRLGVTTTVAIESALYLVDWGPHRYNALHLPLRVDTTHKYHAPMLCGMGFMSWVCLGQDQHHSCCAIQAQWNV